MKIKKISLRLLFVSLVTTLTGCFDKKTEKPVEKEVPLSTFVHSVYRNVSSITDTVEYFKDTQGDRQFLPDKNGVINSPFHTMNINEVDVPVYSCRVGCGIHSFAYILVNEEDVNLNIKITTFKNFNKTVVLPLSSGVVAKTKNNEITANIRDFGNFSFAFDDTNEWGLTLVVAKNEKFTLPQNYNLVEFEPGDYSGGVDSRGLHLDKTQGVFELTEPNTAYYFKKGYYLIHEIKLASNTQVYFEPGTFLDAYVYYENDGSTKDAAAFMSGFQLSNVKIYGNGLVDFSQYLGGGPNNKYRSEFGFSSSNNMEFKGMIGIGSASWTLCFTNCTNIEVDWNMLLSYRECSDGIMLSDCQDSIVHHNFCRVGDDAIEAKSTGSLGSKNLVYEYNAVWADKCRCYGTIYESNRDMENIIFRHNSVGFSVPTWTDLGCLVVVMGTNNETTWHDIHFEDTEIYHARTQILSMYIDASNERAGGFIKNIYFKNITCYMPLGKHEELVYIDIDEGSRMGKCYIDNFMYANVKGDLQKYITDDVSNPMLTHVNVPHTYSLKNIVVS